MKTVKMGKLVLGRIPRVVGVIDQPIAVARLQGYAERGVDAFEIRADLFGKPIGKVVDYAKSVRQSVSSPLIGTVRENDLNRGDRAAWYVALAKHVDCVDIELGMPQWREILDGIMGPAVVMVSEHDFVGTPDFRGLGDIVTRAEHQGAEIVKIAVTANCMSDVTRLMRFTEDCGVPLVTMAMGDFGGISRVIAPLFGSLFSYGYLRKPLVPGQLSAVRIAEAFNEFY
jgi:3-dehydroquinate dehydratase-1